MLEEEKFTTLWGHIADLRVTLLSTFLIILSGLILAFCFYQPLFNFFTSTFHKHNSNSITQSLNYERVTNVNPLPLLYQIPQRNAVIHASKGVKKASPTSYYIETGGFIDYAYPSEPSLILLGPLEGMLLSFKICFWISLALTSPLWGFTWLRFILPGLKTHEKEVLFPFIFCSLFCLSGGCAFAYFVTLPLSNQYLQAFNAGIGKNMWSLAQYMDYTLILILGHAVAFEVCLILLFMVHFQWISVNWLIQQRRYMIVFAFILGALLTPPDVLTQMMLALPLIGIYEVAIWYGKMRLALHSPLNSLEILHE